ncbi:hypothetical protein E6C27_scaffold205G001270 [Cucumis melo var. makuwa]|uniref:Uncharacterized protein n=1 Tax=Cucumis melo var. makuwa TaxID=1194695 RepID=A0A5A7V7W6_CUCMM|nr:hypothetical protein E6C27_scaffold205G001270 [Cucumis melo var. makuwa]
MVGKDEEVAQQFHAIMLMDYHQWERQDSHPKRERNCKKMYFQFFLTGFDCFSISSLVCWGRTVQIMGQ